MAAGPIQAREALKLGRSVLGVKPADEIAEEMTGMSAMEKRFVQRGIREHLDEQMARVKTAFTDPNMEAREAAKALKELSSRGNRDKLRQVLGNEAADDLFNTLDEASIAFELKAAVADNSKTFARTALNERIGRTMDEGPVRALQRGNPVQAGRETLASLLGGGAQARDARSDKVVSALVDALLQPADMAAAGALTRVPSPAVSGAGADRLSSVLMRAPALAAGGQLPSLRR